MSKVRIRKLIVWIIVFSMLIMELSVSNYASANSNNTNITDCDIYGIKDKYYTGNEIYQDFEIYDFDEKLEKDIDYNVQYQDNIDVGTAQVTISGIGSYEGTIVKNFQVMSNQPEEELDLDVEKVAPEGYIQITSIEDLLSIENDPSGKYVLMADIDLTEATKEGGSLDVGHGWTPLSEFSGILDGNGYRIIGMNIYGNPDNEYYEDTSILDYECNKFAGLFARLSGATIKNLGIVDCNININNPLLEDEDDVDYRIGGIAGSAQNTEITNCYVTGNITYSCDEKVYEYCSSLEMGSLVGCYKGEENAAITNCYSTVDLKLIGYQGYYISLGGLIGSLKYMYDTATRDEYIQDCYFAGSQSSEINIDTLNVGTIAGAINKSGMSSDCYALYGSKISGEYEYATSSLDGTVISKAGMSMQAKYTGFDFDSVWTIDKNSIYTYPQIQSNPAERIESMEITAVPSVTEYVQNDTLDTTGGLVQLNYEEERVVKNVAVSKCTLDGYNMEKIGPQYVIVEYRKAKDAYIILVNEIPVEGISIQKDFEAINIDSTLPVQVIFEPADASNQSITWLSDNEEVFTVNNGDVTGIAFGEAKLTAISENGKSASCTISVRQDISNCVISEVIDQYYTGEAIVQNIEISDGNKILTEGQDYQLVYKDNILPGKASVTIEGLGNYSGTHTKEYYILYASSSTATGSGIMAGYTPINSVEDLLCINQNPSGKYILTNDIDLTEATKKGGSLDIGHGWTPLSEFSGVLDGNGYRIIGMNIYGNPDNEYYEEIGYIDYERNKFAGLFSRLSGASIKNLGIVDCNININNPLLEDEDDVDYRIGGIAGSAQNTEITNCYVTGNITYSCDEKVYEYCSSLEMGSLVGCYKGEEYAAITNCYSTVDLKLTGYQGYYVSLGGLIGSLKYMYDTATRDEYIQDCYFAGSQSSEINIDTLNVGTIAGAINKSGMSSNCYALYGSKISGEYEYATSSLDGVQIAESAMSTEVSYIGFDYYEDWEVDVESGYKLPQLKNNRQVRVLCITIEEEPDQTEYFENDSINVSGGKIGITYEDGTNKSLDMTQYMLSEDIAYPIGSKEVILNWGSQKASYMIRVKPIPVTNVEIIGGAQELEKGNTMKLQAIITPNNATYQELSWSSEDEEIATVNNQGVVTAKKAGSCTIYAESVNGVVGEYDIQVTVKCTSIILDKDSLDLYVGESQEIEAEMIPLDSTDTISWSSTNTDVVTVKNGIITAVGPGSAEVKASVSNFVYEKIDISVKQKLDDFYIRNVFDKDYTGDYIMQNVIVTNGTVVLELYNDYLLSYKDNINPGVAKVIVSGVGDYEGTLEKEFVINEVVVDTNPTPSIQPTSAPNYTLTPSIQPTSTPINTPGTPNEKLPVQTSQPSKDDSDEEKISVYSVVEDSESNGIYEVTKSQEGRSEVAYLGCIYEKENIVIPDSVQIEGETFKVTSISSDAFWGDMSLKKIVIGKNIQKIGKQAFYGCKKLKKITIKTVKLKGNTIGSKAFAKIHAKAVVKVPKSKKKLYKNILKKKGINGKKQKIK